MSNTFCAWLWWSDFFYKWDNYRAKFASNASSWSVNKNFKMLWNILEMWRILECLKRAAREMRQTCRGAGVGAVVVGKSLGQLREWLWGSCSTNTGLYVMKVNFGAGLPEFTLQSKVKQRYSMPSRRHNSPCFRATAGDRSKYSLGL